MPSEQKNEKGKLILIVEDSPVQIEVLNRRLILEGYRTVIAHNGAEGLAMAQTLAPALILSDVVMPVMDGYQMCREIKDTPALRDIPVMMLTQLYEPEEIIRGLESGADAYLTKTVGEDLLMAKIRALLFNPLQFRNNPDLKCITFEYGEKSYEVHAERAQTLSFLISTYENAVWNNQENLKVQGRMRTLNEMLEETIAEKTRELAHEVAEHQRTSQALEQLSHERALILEAAGEGICTFDVNGHHVLVNPSAARMFGYEAEEMIGRHSHSLWHYAKADGTPYPEEECPIYISMRDGVTHHSENELFWRKDGTGFPVEYVSAPIQSNGTLTGGVLVFHDITERKQAEEKIHRLNDELELKVRERTQQLLDAQEELVRKEKLALLGQVAGSLGHELRNPLGVMNNAIYFLQTVLADADETIREYLEIITTEIANADCILSDLLDSVRTKPPQPEAIGLAELIHQILRKVNVPAAITVALDLPESLHPVRVDARQIQQVFRNLVSNGVEAMVEGGTLAIGAIENLPEGTVRVSVRDTGCGMPQEVLAQLFQPLFTTKARGIGLGLVVVKNLTEANGGHVEVQSEPGQGTTFSVTLPADSQEGNQYA